MQPAARLTVRALACVCLPPYNHPFSLSRSTASSSLATKSKDPFANAVFLPAGWLALAVARGWNDLLRPPKTRRLHTPGANPTSFPQPPHAALRARTPCSSLKNVSLERVGP